MVENRQPAEAAATQVKAAKGQRKAAKGQRPVRVCLHAAVPVRRDVRARRVASTLAAAGYQVTTVDMEHAGAPPASPADLERVRVRHITLPRWTERFYVPTHPVRWLLFKVWRWMRGIGVVVRTPADVYHACDMGALPACYFAARLRRKPLVFESYEMPLVEPHVTRRRLVYAVSRRFLRHVLRRTAAVIVVSPPIADEVRKRFGGPQPIVLRNIPTYRPRVESNRIREHLGLPASARIALYQGHMEPNRGLDQTVLAGKYLPSDHVVVLLGDGPSLDGLRALVEREALGDRVKLLPAVPYEELLTWTASADLGLAMNPPEYSANVRMMLPNKVFEYLMAGLPVLASPMRPVEDLPADV